MRMFEPALFLLPVWNLTQPSCFLTPISSTMREFWRFNNIYGRNWHIYVCMSFQDLLAQNSCFWSKMGKGVVRCLPLTNLFLLLGVVSSVLLCRKSVKKCHCESADRQAAKDVFVCSVLIYVQRIRGFTTMLYINLRFTYLLTYLQTNRHTLRQRQSEFIICPVLYAIAMGQIKMHCIGNVAIRYTELTSEPDGQIDGHRWSLIERLQPYSNGIAASKTLQLRWSNKPANRG